VLVVTWICLFLARNVSGIDAFGYLGTIGVLSLLLAYLATTVGGIAYFTKKALWRGVVLIIPILALVTLCYTLYSNIYPVPPIPMNYFPYIVIAWIIIGLVLIKGYPSMVKNIAKRFAEESKITIEGRS
jgi:amino acid transporter